MAIVAASLRLLFDPDFSYLLFQHGSYMAGYILLALGALMSIVALFGLASVLIERPCLLWAVSDATFPIVEPHYYAITVADSLTFSFLFNSFLFSCCCLWSVKWQVGYSPTPKRPVIKSVSN